MSGEQPDPTAPRLSIDVETLDMLNDVLAAALNVDKAWRDEPWYARMRISIRLQDRLEKLERVLNKHGRRT